MGRIIWAKTHIKGDDDMFGDVRNDPNDHM
jgi:hypothetical protein